MRDFACREARALNPTFAHRRDHHSEWKIGYSPEMSNLPGFVLRPATGEDFAFAESIYIEAMRSLMEPLVKWNEVERRAALRRSFKAADAIIIVVEGRDIGWMQVSERDTDYNLAQLQLVEAHRCKGIGTRLIRDLLERAKREARTVSLSVVRTNRAIGLYRRLGFRIIDPEATPIIDMVWGDGLPATGA
jgi:ribosomal protein S18 acetylase RimI-like enzyme